ncbi:MAG: hypothetical protein JSS09_08735, partial [Verrucomicrobia bacterium]|nr:hypothetical protein [Verrucomicrobiota bacterium]
MNVDTVPFNPSGDCESGGLYFTDEKHIFYWAKRLECSYIADVSVPEDAKVYQGCDKTKWKADRLVLNNIRSLKQFIGELKTPPDEFGFVFVKQTPELCLEAVLRDGLNLQFVKEQTSELCKLAVQQ